jgi:hypothetical protein
MAQILVRVREVAATLHRLAQRRSQASDAPSRDAFKICGGHSALIPDP